MGEQEDWTSTLVFYVNGRKVVCKDADPDITLLQFLRRDLFLTGTKLACGSGACGACTILISRYDHINQKICHQAQNACLTPLVSVHGLAVTTIEGLGSTATVLNPLQARLADNHGSQCGFCSPGIVMTMFALLRNNPNPSTEQIHNVLEGNWCRCTGYRPISDSYKDVRQTECPMGESCCRNGPVDECSIQNGINENAKEKDNHHHQQDQELIFPPELMLSDSHTKDNLKFFNGITTWLRPCSMVNVLELMKFNKNARLVGGGSLWAFQRISTSQRTFIYLDVADKDIKSIRLDEAGLIVGSMVTLSTLEQACEGLLKMKAEDQCSKMPRVIMDMLTHFDTPHVKNIATVGGNMCLKNSDLKALFYVLCGTVSIITDKGTRNESISDALKSNPGEIVKEIYIPPIQPNEHVFNKKQHSPCKINMVVKVTTGSTPDKPVEKVVAVMGDPRQGLIDLSHAARTTTITAACEEISNELKRHGIDDIYKIKLVTGWYTDCLEQARKICNEEGSQQQVSPERFFSQYVQEGHIIQGPHDQVGQPVRHQSAREQCSGEARFLDDIPKRAGELEMQLVLSTKAHAKLKSIDGTRALNMPGVVSFLSAKDFEPERNYLGCMFDNAFAIDDVNYFGSIIGAVVAKDKPTAERAARLVQTEYEDLPVVLTVEDAIKGSHFHVPPIVYDFGNFDAGLLQTDHVFDGSVRIGGQRHFYMETQGSIAIPAGEKGEMEITSSTQGPAYVQKDVALALGVPANRITVNVKRIGGGFGGKEHIPSYVAVPAALAAHKLGHPVRCVLDRVQDMLIAGGRHPVLVKYKVGVSQEDKIHAIEVKVYANCGHTIEHSENVMFKFFRDFCASCAAPNLKMTIFLCKTNIRSSTAFRGFGSPQAQFVHETIMHHLADSLGKSYQEIRPLNFVKVGTRLHFGQTLDVCDVEGCWQQLLETSSFLKRRNDVESFNRNNAHIKRGIQVTPTVFPTGFFVKELDQGAALVNIYRDGSVLVSHGGIEMGQGLHTKVLQVASRALGIDMNLIHIKETRTDCVPNATVTAASMGGDLYCPAIKNACDILRERLAPYLADNKPWNDSVNEAIASRVHLSAIGHHKTKYNVPNDDLETILGAPHHYVVCGASCSEVELDCTTGNIQVLRTDIVMDLGKTLNPCIDIGQIEGAFMQGFGLFMLEEERYTSSGQLLSKSAETYSIPTIRHLPRQFNVALRPHDGSKTAIYSSKAVGEPPLFLAASIFFAAKMAVCAARKDKGLSPIFQLDAPATFQRLLLACDDFPAGSTMVADWKKMNIQL